MLLQQARGLTAPHVRSNAAATPACCCQALTARSQTAAASLVSTSILSTVPGCPASSNVASSLSSTHWQLPGLRHYRSAAAAAAAEPQPVSDGSDAGAAAEASEPPAAAAAAAAPQEWAVLNFYHLVDIPDPEEMLARHKAFIAAHGLDSICGRIYISKQGINCQGGGTQEHTQRYVEWVAAQPEFAGLFHTLWPAPGPMFPRLRLKLKPNLISLACGMENIRGITDPAARATPLDPAAWRAKMEAARAVNAAVEAGNEDQSKRIVVMDLRNDYEWDAGHFDWAPRPEEEVFAETPVPLAGAAAGPGPGPAAAAAASLSASDSDDDMEEEGEEGGDSEDDESVRNDMPSPLRDADPDNTEVLMYCTGGIRCDVYSALLRAKGFRNLYTLHGGIQHYLREEGNEHWRGSLFVFDGRMAINPALQRDAGEDVPLPAAVPCQLCGGEASLPHVNCANMDCNELFIACSTCKARYHGCCCEGCQSAPRLLRPIKLEGGNYGSWQQYADANALAPLISTKRRHEGRVARRARRRAALKEKREATLQERRELRAAMKAAVRAAEEAAAAAAAAAAAGGTETDAPRSQQRRQLQPQ